MFNKQCPVCNKWFHKVNDANTRRYTYCSLICAGKARKQYTICPVCGNSFHKRRKFTKHCSYKCASTARKTAPKTFTCINCHKEFSVMLQPSRVANRKYCSRKCRTDYETGENNPAWSGGKAEYYGANWNAQRRKARTRDQYKCQKCGIEENKLKRQLDVHHKMPFKSFGVLRYKEANQLDNLISLCQTCHHTVENNLTPMCPG